MGEPRTSVAEALAAWEDKGPTSLTTALLADALYGVREAVERAAAIEPQGSGDWVESGVAMRTTVLREIGEVR